MKIINLSNSLNLIKTPDFTGIPNLENLILEGCTSLFEVHPSLARHKKLQYVNLTDCVSIRIFPSNLEMESLKVFFLHNLPQSFLGWPSIYGFSCSLFLNHWAFILSLSFIIDSISVFILPNNISLIAPSVGCDLSQGFFLKENILPGSKWDCKG